MSKRLVLFQSKYGATRKYADMLKEEYGWDILETKDYDSSVVKNYDTILFAGGIYAGGIAGIRCLKKHYPEIKNKNLAVFCVGALPFDEKAMEELKLHNMKEELSRIPLFYGRGKWDESVMSLKDRFMCGVLKKMVGKQSADSLEPWMKELLSSIGQKCDWADKTYLLPLIEAIDEMEKR